ncbi:MAG: V-type ATP synthase subunit B, partial [Nitrososphaerota archaeon]|nr:V-type ATP synthase subunit B [Nitrososphaerota archaeon]
MSGSISYSSVLGIRGSIMVIRTDGKLGYEELVEIELNNGEKRLGRSLQASQDTAVVEVFEGTQGISSNNSKIRFLGRPLELPVSNELLGRIFDGLGRPLDSMPAPVGVEEWDINGMTLNPYKREYPDEFIQTGVSVMDGMLSLIRGQKLPIFSGSGLPHDMLASQIARQSTIATGEEFAVVFGAIGVPADTAMFFRKELEESGALKRSVLFLNLAEDPAIERIVTPRIALTAAEYLAFEQGLHVLTILTDMTNYGEALREISILREEVPSRRGYPGYLYTDLATIFERSGKVTGKNGSLTQLPILSMPGDDITHPIPDLTAYITEGQVVLDKDLY